MPTYSGYPADSPEWWLRYLVQMLMDQQSRYDLLEDYHLGNHPLPRVNPEHASAVKHFQKMARTNYVKLVNDSPVGRMRVKDFAFGEGGDPDADAKRVWAVNDMDLQSAKLHSAAAVFGDGYLLIGPPDLETGLPTMTVKDPRVAIVEPNPMYPTKSLAGLEMWEDKVRQEVIAVLHLPDTLYTYVAPSSDWPSGDKTSITNRLLGSSLGIGNFELVGEAPNPLGEVALVHFEWQPDYNGMSLGEAELVLDIQDRINQMIMDRLVTANSQAFQKLFGTGVTPAEDKKGGPKKGPTKPPFELGANKMWVTANENAKFGAIPAVDFKQMLEATQDDVADIAALTQTPGHYLMGRMANVSGDTLTQSESGFVSKTKLRMKAMGWGWERAMRLAFKYMGLAKATEPEVSVKWADPMVRKDVESSDAASKWIAGGLELGVAMERFGDFTSEQVTFAREKLAEQKAEEAEVAQQQLEIAATKANQPAGGKPKNSQAEE